MKRYFMLSGKGNKRRFIYLTLLVLSFFLTSFVSAEGSAVRSMHSTYTPGTPVLISINVSFNSTDCGGAVVENILSGWGVDQSEIFGNGSGYYNSILNTITWAPLDAPHCNGESFSYLIGYVVTPNESQSGNKTFSGFFGVDGRVYLIAGNTNIISASTEDVGSTGGSGGFGGGSSGGGGGAAAPKTNSVSTDNSLQNTSQEEVPQDLDLGNENNDSTNQNNQTPGKSKITGGVITGFVDGIKNNIGYVILFAFLIGGVVVYYVVKIRMKKEQQDIHHELV